MVMVVADKREGQRVDGGLEARDVGAVSVGRRQLDAVDRRERVARLDFEDFGNADLSSS